MRQSMPHNSFNTRRSPCDTGTERFAQRARQSFFQRRAQFDSRAESLRFLIASLR